MTKGILLASAAAFIMAAPAFAQNTSTPTGDNTSSSAANGSVTPGAAAPSAAPSPSEPGEIVITATRRAQALATVPIAVSAVTAESLQNSGATDIRQLNQLAPSLLVSSTSSEANGSARIRGVGTVGDNPGLESSVAVFIDGVYRSRSGIGLNELGEVERIEVLRGPQGTLFGRNASAGLINIISKKPSFDSEGAAALTYGNYDYWRGDASLTGAFGDSKTLAYRLDGVYVKRDGFYRNATVGGGSESRDNNRDRYYVKGQILYEPTDQLSVRLIADYTHRNENCCAATYVDRSVNPAVGNLNDPVPSVNAGVATFGTGNNIVNVLRDLGQPLALVQSPGHSRAISVTPGRSYQGITKDAGVSGQVDYNLGAATLTSITAYRDYKSDQGSDTDYSTVDILYRAADGNSSRQFKTFTQELRLQGDAFNNKLDWLVGGFFADEDLTVRDNLKFGNQYGRFATCRLVSGGGLAPLYNPAAAGCIASQAAFSGAFGAAGPLVLASLLRLDGLNNLGSTIDTYKQNSRNYALFTHNIFHVTDTIDVTGGIRYTHERKTFDALFGNNNTVCPANQAALLPFLANPALAAVAGGIIGLSCQGNSTSELNGVAINSKRSEHRLTGTAILSWKPIDHLLTYASYSRGYKSGGFNLDRSALKSPIGTFAAAGGAQALVGTLQFAPETVNAYELGAKYATGPFFLSVAAFRQEFKNFQLNTFNGTVFLVQNINGCDSSLGGGDRDQSKFTGAPNYSATAAATGACAADDVSYGVRAQGVELEAALSPVRDLRVALGATFSDTGYRSNLVGNSAGAPLDQALRVLPGKRLSNAPSTVLTSSITFTPDIGSHGLSALFYIDGRRTSDYNTGSDLFPQKEQEGYFIANARIGLRGPDERWSLEFWGQNIFNKQYSQVAFNSPFQEGAVSTTATFADPQYPGGRQLFSQFLAEPRTYGVTVRTKF